MRTVDVRLQRPLQTAVGEMRTAPLALVDLQSAEGVTGSSYVFCSTPAWPASRRACARSPLTARSGA